MASINGTAVHGMPALMPDSVINGLETAAAAAAAAANCRPTGA
jgi:hypothetical protein